MSEEMQQLPQRRPILILDANAFINCSKIYELGAKYRLATTQDVLDELKDEKTKEYIKKMPFEIEVKDFDSPSLVFVKEFSKKTGDIGSLSTVDIELIALTHTLYVRQGLKDRLRKQPPPIKQTEAEVESFQGSQTQQNSEGNIGEEDSYHSSDEEMEEDEGWITVPKGKKPQKEEEEDDMGDQQGWVTPQNYDLKMAEIHTEFLEPNSKKNPPYDQQTQNVLQPADSAEQEFQVVLISADFSIQNVATQMGIKLMALDGRVIQTVRRFIWECYLCWKQYTITSNKVKVCSNCGYNSLSKISYSMDTKGNVVLHRKKGWKPNLKVQEWKQRKFEEEQKKKKHQHSRRTKKSSIFENI